MLAGDGKGFCIYLFSCSATLWMEGLDDCGGGKNDLREEETAKKQMGMEESVKDRS